MKHNKTKKLEIIFGDELGREELGRGVRAGEKIKKGEFVCEYKYDEQYPRRERAERAEEHAVNEDGSFVLEVQIPGGKWFCLDATSNPESWAR